MTAIQAVAEPTIEVPFSPYDVRGLRNPYLGLRSYGYEQQAVFAGREAKIAAAVGKLTADPAPNLLFVSGASGSGKSSFVMAGLLPALEQHYRNLGLEPLLATTRPGSYPLAGLYDALLQLNLADDFELDERLFATATTFADYLRTNTPAQQVNLILLDQFEESFTQAEAGQRERLLDILSNLPSFSAARTQVICTVRADYLPALFERPHLYEAAVQGVVLERMSGAELSAAIRVPVVSSYPAQDVEPGLVERLTTEASADASLLPLLQVTLEELWADGWLRLSEYVNQYENNIGYALRKKADAVYSYRDYAGMQEEPRSEAEQQAMLTMLLDLVQVSLEDPTRDVRAQRTRQELTREEPLREGLVDDLAAARLLSTGRDARTGATLVSVTHESLIQHWPRLRAEINRRRGELEQRTRFSQALSEWQGQGRREEYLLRGVRLSEGMSLAAAGDVVMQQGAAREYVQASRARAEAEQATLLRLAQEAAENARRAQAEAEKRAEAEAGRRELAEQALVATSEKLVAEQHIQSERAEKEAAQIRAEEAGRLLRRTRVFTAAISFLLIVALLATFFAFSNANAANNAKQQAQSSQATAVAEATRADAAKQEALNSQVTAVAEAGRASAAQQVAATAQAEAEANLKVADSERLAAEAQIQNQQSSSERAILLAAEALSRNDSPRTRAALTSVLSQDQWDVTTVISPTSVAKGVVWSPDGQRVLTFNDSTAQLWDRSGKLLQVYTGKSDSTIQTAVISPDNSRIVVIYTDKNQSAELWEADGSSRVALNRNYVPQYSSFYKAEFNRAGDRLLVKWYGEGTYMWDADGHNIDLAGASPDTFSVDGQRVLAYKGNDSALYDAGSGQQLVTLAGFPGAISPNGQIVATRSITGSVYLFSSTGKQVATLTGHTARVVRVAFSGDGQRLASSADDGTARLWTLDGKLLTTVQAYRSISYLGKEIVLDYAGKHLLTKSGRDPALLWDDRGLLLSPLASRQIGYLSSFSPDGRYVLISSNGNDAPAAQLLSADGSLLSVMPGSGAAFSERSSDIATLANNGTVYLLHEGRAFATAPLTDTVSNIYLSNSNLYVFSRASSQPTSEYEVRTYTTTFSVYPAALTGLPLSSFSIPPSPASPLFDERCQRVSLASVNPNIPSTDGFNNFTTTLWLTDGTRVGEVVGNHLALSPDCRFMITTDLDAHHSPTISLWTITTSLVLQLPGAGLGFVGKYILKNDGYCGDGACLSLWDVKGNRVRQFSGEDFKLSPDASYLLAAMSGGPDTYTRTYSILDQNGNSTATLTGRRPIISPDGDRVALMVADGRYQLYDRHGKPLNILLGLTDNVGEDNKVVFSHDRSYISTSPGRAAYLYDWNGNAIGALDSGEVQMHAPDGKTTLSLVGHNKKVTAISFSPDHMYIATTSTGDGTVRLWNSAGRNLQVFYDVVQQDGPSPQFSADGRWLLVPRRDNSLGLYPTGVDDLLGTANCRIGRNLTPAEQQQFGVDAPLFHYDPAKCQRRLAGSRHSPPPAPYRHSGRCPPACKPLRTVSRTSRQPSPLLHPVVSSSLRTSRSCSKSLATARPSRKLTKYSLSLRPPSDRPRMLDGPRLRRVSIRMVNTPSSARLIRQLLAALASCWRLVESSWGFMGMLLVCCRQAVPPTAPYPQAAVGKGRVRPLTGGSVKQLPDLAPCAIAAQHYQPHSLSSTAPDLSMFAPQHPLAG